MTEAEAKKKWCPMVRFNYCGLTITDNNRCDGKGGGNCIASGCMVWRNQPMVRDTDSGELYPDNGNVMFSFGYEIVEGHGFCGLGGKP